MITPKYERKLAALMALSADQSTTDHERALAADRAVALIVDNGGNYLDYFPHGVPVADPFDGIADDDERDRYDADADDDLDANETDAVRRFRAFIYATTDWSN